MVNIVVLSAGPERNDMVQTPGKLVPAVRINGLEQTENDPQIHGQNVQILGDCTPKDRPTNRAKTENQDFDRGCVLSSKTERSRVLVVYLMDVPVKRSPVHGSVHPVVPCILKYEKDGDLEGHLVDAGERDRGGEADELAHGVEKPDLREFDGEVREENEESALPLLPGCRDFVLEPCVSPRRTNNRVSEAYLLDLVLLEVGDHINDNPGQRTPEVDGFVHNKRHDSSGQNIILHERVPRKP
jgi:hypothetical protein